METYFPFKEETYQILGICMEVHNYLGAGFLEVVYKDALEIEFKNAGIHFEREKEYTVNYKGNILKHKFFADFIVFDKIILEVKAVKTLADEHIAQTINYLKVSDEKIALLVNFNEPKLNYKRLIL
ncbi:MAG: GxxExxY protein [Chitinophagaceae bacterium]|nr:GxxExxY protein [Chitinophagaceae bacterium]